MFGFHICLVNYNSPVSISLRAQKVCWCPWNCQGISQCLDRGHPVRNFCVCACAAHREQLADGSAFTAAHSLPQRDQQGCILPSVRWS